MWLVKRSLQLSMIGTATSPDNCSCFDEFLALNWIQWFRDITHTPLTSQFQLSSKLWQSDQARFRNVLPLKIQLVSPRKWLSLPNNHHWSLTIILLHLLCCKSMWQQFYVDLNLVYSYIFSNFYWILCTVHPCQKLCKCCNACAIIMQFINFICLHIDTFTPYRLPFCNWRIDYWYFWYFRILHICINDLIILSDFHFFYRCCINYWLKKMYHVVFCSEYCLTHRI